MHKHDLTNDYVCLRCGMTVMTYIPHECDPTICVYCNGTKRQWYGTTPGRRAGFYDCVDCAGTGKTIWKDDDGLVGAPI